MPNQSSSRPDADAQSAPGVQPTISSTKQTLHDLFTGGWTRPIAGLPTALGRPLARWTSAGRSRMPHWHVRTPGGGAQR
jgi:hypothetical protein